MRVWGTGVHFLHKQLLCTGSEQKQQPLKMSTINIMLLHATGWQIMWGCRTPIKSLYIHCRSRAPEKWANISKPCGNVISAERALGYYTHRRQSSMGYNGFTLSVRPSDRPSVDDVRSVSSAVPSRPISYLHILPTNFRRWVACWAFEKIPKFEFLPFYFFNFIMFWSPLDEKICKRFS